jgi:hypothetical protein
MIKKTENKIYKNNQYAAETLLTQSENFSGKNMNAINRMVPSVNMITPIIQNNKLPKYSAEISINTAAKITRLLTISFIIHFLYLKMQSTNYS